MSDKAKLDPSEWLARHSLPGQVVDDSRMELSGSYPNIDLQADAPEGVPLVFTGAGASVAFNLNGHRLPIIDMRQAGQVQIGGPGTVGLLKATAANGAVQIFLMSGARLETIDSVESIHLAITQHGGEIGHLITGENPLEVQGQGLHVDRLTHHGTTLTLKGNNLSAGSLAVDRADEVTIQGGWLSVPVLEPLRINLAKNGGLTVTDHLADSVITLDGSAAFAIRGRQAVGEKLRFRGTGAVQVMEGRLIEPVFDEGSHVRLELHDDAEASLVTGPTAVGMWSGSIITGNERDGLVVHSLKLRDEGVEAVESLNFFKLDPGNLPLLSDVERVSAWWPALDQLRHKAKSIDCNVRSEESQKLARARYWLSVERLLSDKAATGRDLALAHEVAEDSRRLVSSWNHGERVLLELSRLAGYGSRIGRPLLLWVAAAGVFAILLRAMTGGVCLAGCSADSGLTLWWDVLIAPVSFIRPVEDGSTLTTAVEGDTPARILAFTARAFGTWMLVSLALAVRRYIHTT